MTDSYTQVAPDSTGDKIATSEVTNDAGDVVQRQQITIADALVANAVASVSRRGELKTETPELADLLSQILTELRVMNYMLRDGLHITDTVNSIRASYSNGQT